MEKKLAILVIDDESQIRRLLKMSLEAAGYVVYEAATATEGFNILRSNRSDMVILDLGLPDMDGLQFVYKVREWTPIPIIILTVRESEKDKIALLEAGADDYLTKPFSLGELKARMLVAFRHYYKEKDIPVFHCGSLSIDFSKRLVKIDDKEIKLTPKEYAILALLARHAGKVLTQNQILKELWGPAMEEEKQYLRIYIMMLRRKLEKDPSNPQIIITEPGVGYRLI